MADRTPNAPPPHPTTTPPSLHPPLPPNIRPATPADIPRIGMLYIAAFHFSPNMAWQRPWHSKYPEDTLEWYVNEARRVLEDENYVALVAEDAYIERENESTGAKGVEEVMKGTKEGELVPVAIGVWNVGAEMGRKWREGMGKGLVGAKFPPATTDFKFRDRHQAHYDSLCGRVHTEIEKYFTGLTELDMLATHPAYWGRGYGKNLVVWGLDFAKMYNVGQGVVGPPMGMKLYLRKGFKLVKELEWEGDEVTPQGLHKGIAVWTPDGKYESELQIEGTFIK